MPEIDAGKIPDQPYNARGSEATSKPEPVRQPETPEERRKRKLANLSSEGDDERFERRAAELQQHLDTHISYVQEAHEKYPAPLHRDWESMTSEEQTMWNARRREIDSANKAYARAVQLTVDEHRVEDMHIAQAVADAARKSQEVA